MISLEKIWEFVSDHKFIPCVMLISLTTSCASQSLQSISPSAIQQTDSTIKDIESDSDFRKFRADLKQREIELTSPSTSRVAWLRAAPGVGYTVGRYQMNVHLYPDAASARESADQIPEDASMVTATWIARPHFFLCDRIIALYLGSDGGVTSALTELCGPRFSGFVE